MSKSIHTLCQLQRMCHLLIDMEEVDALDLSKVMHSGVFSVKNGKKLAAWLFSKLPREENNHTGSFLMIFA